MCACVRHWPYCGVGSVCFSSYCGLVLLGKAVCLRLFLWNQAKRQFPSPLLQSPTQTFLWFRHALATPSSATRKLEKAYCCLLAPSKKRRCGDLYLGLRLERLSITQICACATLLVLNTRVLFGYAETIRIYDSTVSQRNTAQAQ